MSTIINDRFRTYYIEKLWEMIPAIYRHEDGLAENPGVLRAIIEVIGEQAAILRRSQDRLWEDQFIELCDDWAVPYIGELLATRLLSAQNTRGRRIDVAKTIYYRRRKGTPRILEELISDISNWDGKLVESFQRLVRARHGLDPKPAKYAGRFTGTLPGGAADLRSPSGSELSNGPFDEYFHTPDFRKPKGLDGRYGISKLNFYMYRLISNPVINATPFHDNGKYTFDPSGRSIPLFNNRRRPDKNEWEKWQSALEWELPLPIRCRLLAHAEYIAREEHIQLLPFTNAEKDELRNVIGWRFRNEAALWATVNTFTSLKALFTATPEQFLFLVEHFLVGDCGKSQLIPAALKVGDPVIVAKENILPASLENWSVGITNKHLAIDAERGRFIFLNVPPDPKDVIVTYHYGFLGPLGAGTYDRREVEDSEPTAFIPPVIVAGEIDLSGFNPSEVIEISDNKTYKIITNPNPIQDFVLQAANQQRPYLVLQAHLVFNSLAKDATLILDGLWIGSTDGNKFDIILRGDYECVVIRNCTLDPGGGINAKGDPLMPVSLIIEGKIENLCIEKSITGPIHFEATSLVDESLIIHDSIIQSIEPINPGPAVPAIITHSGILDIQRSTVLGSISVHRLYASEVIITELATVADNQAGCFRFSAAPAMSVLPHPYESFLFEKDTRHWFVSRLFGQPGYGQLSETAPPDLQRGAENGSEMGAFSSLLNPIKSDGLKIKVEEYMPFGLIPAFINQT